MGLIQPVENLSTGLAQPSPPGHTTREASLGKDAFMSLLLAELRNQDPLNPMDDTDFIAQLAQFNALEQLQDMNETLKEFLALQELSQASALIGKTVSGYTTNGQYWTGMVGAVVMRQGRAILQVDGQEMALNQVTNVT